MIDNGTHVRIRNVHADKALIHVDGFEGTVVYSYTYVPGPGVHIRRYTVNVNGLDYDLSASELEVL